MRFGSGTRKYCAVMKTLAVALINFLTIKGKTTVKYEFEIPFSAWHRRKERHKAAKAKLRKIAKEHKLPGYYVENPGTGLSRVGFNLKVTFFDPLNDSQAEAVERALMINGPWEE